MSTYEEWRVTGTDEDGDHVSVTWWHGEEDPEEGARSFTVTVTDWEAA